ncbi:phage tail protein I [Sphingomonas melonis]|uniref:phage tail protein I n=1 Tax=Sphingomonas melonis TaxID=152682 RepID=UPI000BE35764|nr:phage tail protein I [Sphingomonas melonis]ATI54503.1 phage tail protein I [Sphingomonas melonis]
MTTLPSLLPPNATAFERALETAARSDAIAAPIDTLVDPARIEAAWLPWLAYGLSVDSWDADWSEAEKRSVVAGSIALHRQKGTRASVETVLARFDGLARLIEWHEATPRAAPHTFTIDLPMVTSAGEAPGGRRSTAAFADAIIREIARVKPLREHLTLVQSIPARGSIGIQSVARVVSLTRSDGVLTPDTASFWADLLQTEDGEPIEAEDDTLLDATR